MLPESARDEERAANTGRRSELRVALLRSARDKERSANTGRRSEQGAVLPENARDEERAANANNHHETISCTYHQTMKLSTLPAYLLCSQNYRE